MKRPPRAFELVRLRRGWQGWPKGHSCKVTSRHRVMLDSRKAIRVVRVRFNGLVTFSAHLSEDLFKKLFEVDTERYFL